MDDKILDEILNESTFLNPYLKQFKNYLTDKPVVNELGSNNDKYLNELIKLGCTIGNDNLDGLIVINTNNYKDKIEQLIKDIYSSLKDDGYLFIVLKPQTKEKSRIEFYLEDNYKIIEEFIGDENWNFLLYQKSTS